MAKHRVEVTAIVEIEIDGDSTALTRATDNIDDFHEFFRPPITTAEQVLTYLAEVAVRTGVDDASRLDGWADLERGQARMDVIEVYDATVVSR